MNDLRELYQDVILDHSRSPRNFRHPADANRQAEGHNTSCGDRLMVYLKVTGGIVQDIAFEGSGCAISTASASLMTELLKGKTVAQAEEIYNLFHEYLTTGSPGEHPEPPEGIGKLAVLGGVREFPIRVKCATLSWHTMHAALEQAEGVVSNEDTE
jgi:nitrogen fixation NifU-like protein